MTDIRNTEFSKVIVGITILGMIAFGFSFAVPQAQALTQAEVNVICTLVGCDASTQAALQALVSGGSATGTSFTFTRDLTIGSTGQDVMELQKFLNANGYNVAVSGVGSAGMETSYFGSLTAAALAKYQAAKGITPAVGYFGPITRSSVNAQVSSGSGSGTGSTSGSGTLQGGAGSITDADFVSSLNNEEVGEGEEDVEVAGLEIEASRESDIELRAVTLNFSKVTSGGDDDFDDYADEVSVWFDGEEVARVDGRTFEDDDNYTRTVTLDGGAVIEADETGDLVVAVSAVRNLDTTNEGKTWNVEFISVRYRDAQNAIITESAQGDINGVNREFSFESFASAADIELQISDGDDAVNDARTIELDENDDTDDVEIFSFELEAEGDSDLFIDDLPISITVASSTDIAVSDVVSAISLWVDGEKVGSESISTATASSTSETLRKTFEDLDWTLDAGDTVEVIVSADIKTADSDFGQGTTISMAITSADRALIDVEDEEGDDLPSSDRSGTADSDAHTLVSEGVDISFVSATESTKDTNGDTAGGEEGVYKITFDVSAFGEDIYIPTGATSATSSVTANKGASYQIEDSDGVGIILGGGTGTTTAVVSSSADQSGSYFKVDDGSTESFTLSVTFDPTVDGFYRLQLWGVNYNLETAAAADSMQRANPEEDFESEYEDLDA